MANFLIAPPNNQQSGPGYTAGMQTDLKPWLIPDDAFQSLRNAYVWRGRVRKRFGTYLMNTYVSPQTQPLYSRLRVPMGVIGAGGTLADNVNTYAPYTGGTQNFVGQMFVVGDPGTEIIYTVTLDGAGQPMLASDGVSAGTYSTVTGGPFTQGDFDVAGPVGANVYWYPALPVMALATLEVPALNQESTFAFDTQYSYLWYTYPSPPAPTPGAWGGYWAAIPDKVWHGNDSQFFWSCNWRGIEDNSICLYVVNHFASNALGIDDGLAYFDGLTWNTYRPVINTHTGDTLVNARIILQFRDRLLVMNTIEKDFATGQYRYYSNRVRCSQAGNPIHVPVTNPDPWDDYVPGKGFAIDATTSEAILSACVMKDRLIVYFERSTWELIDTGNNEQPFLWRQLNSELGAESSFSMIKFDRAIIGVGNTGIHACNGVNVDRIDSKIPDTVFQIHNSDDGVGRVYGIRDYFPELCYWTFPDEKKRTKFPTRVLVFNYKTLSWAINNDSFTCFGYFQKDDNSTWRNVHRTWLEAGDPWGSASNQAKHLNVIAGNQEGFVFYVDANCPRNAPSLSIVDIAGLPLAAVYCKDHNLSVGDYVCIENYYGLTINNPDNPDNIFQILSIPIDPITGLKSTDIFEINGAGITGTYLGGGTVARVSAIDILTKQYNFFAQDGRRFAVNHVRFLVDKTNLGEIVVDAYTNASSESIKHSGDISGANDGTMTLDTWPYMDLEQHQERFWHRVYMDAEGEVVQLRLYFNDAQMKRKDVAWAKFTLHAMLFSAQPTAPL